MGDVALGPVLAAVRPIDQQRPHVGHAVPDDDAEAQSTAFGHGSFVVPNASCGTADAAMRAESHHHDQGDDRLQERPPHLPILLTRSHR